MQSLTGKNTGDSLTAVEWNQLPAEVQNVINGLGIALSPGDLNQLGKAIAGYAANGNYYTDSGAADAYVLSVVGAKQRAPAYSNGFTALFVASNNNTGASTVNIAGLGVKSIVDRFGAVLPAGAINQNDITEIVFDAGNDRFVFYRIRETTTVPVGASINWNLNTPPAGFLEEDGSAVSRVTYADLFAVIGVAYGPGDGVNTFNLPDKRGKFPRYWNNGAGVDPDTLTRTNRGDGTTGDNVGTNQPESLLAHEHLFSQLESNWSGGPNVFDIIGRNSGPATYTTTSGPTGNQNSPVNIYVMSCIKF